MELLANEAQVDAHFGPFGDCGSIGSEIILDASDGIPVKYCFGPFGDKVSIGDTRWYSKVMRLK
jgi:hypothetical protein